MLLEASLRFCWCEMAVKHRFRNLRVMSLPALGHSEFDGPWEKSFPSRLMKLLNLLATLLLTTTLQAQEVAFKKIIESIRFFFIGYDILPTFKI